jgi:hypothetical protein
MTRRPVDAPAPVAAARLARKPSAPGWRAASAVAFAGVHAGLLLAAPPALAQAGTVFRCPGPPVLYTDQLTAQEAKDKGCRTIEGAPITIVQGVRPRPVAASAPASGAAGARPGEGRVDPAEQRARDSDARRILTEELRREEARLAELMREFNNGEPERRGDERNYARYQERVAEMRAAIQRKEADLAAIRRELAKLPTP